MSAAEATTHGGLVGAVLSRKYRLTRKIGEGGMGEVYAAESLSDGSRCAVKILHRALVTDVAVLGRFLEEGRLSQRLAHPNIVRVLDADQAEDGTPYIVMELLDGVPLSAYTGGSRRVDVHHAVAVLHGILAGLGAAHALGVVHRDLKPDNVFLARDRAGRYEVKILDFGIAKVMDAAGGMGARTRTGMILGTPAYMSPEQIENSKDVDARSDLFGAGVLFYEMLTGRSAFPAVSEFERLSKVLHDDPEPLDRFDPSLAPLVPFVARAMHKDRAVRFQTADEMARAVVTAAGDDSQLVRVATHGFEQVAPHARLPDVTDLARPTLRSVPPLDVAHTPPPHGTLQSRTPLAPPPLERAARVEIVRAPVIGLSLWVAGLLVAGALGAGFFLGFVVARVM